MGKKAVIEAALGLANYLAGYQQVECQVCGNRVCRDSCLLQQYKDAAGIED